MQHSGLENDLKSMHVVRRFHKGTDSRGDGSSHCIPKTCTIQERQTTFIDMPSPSQSLKVLSLDSTCMHQSRHVMAAPHIGMSPKHNFQRQLAKPFSAKTMKACDLGEVALGLGPLQVQVLLEALGPAALLLLPAARLLQGPLHAPPLLLHHAHLHPNTPPLTLTTSCFLFRRSLCSVM